MWRTLQISDLTATLSQAELDAFRRSAGYDGQDPCDALLSRTAEMIRGYCKANPQVSICPDGGTIPEALVSAACDYAAYDVLKRMPVDVGEDRRRARTEAIQLFKDVSTGAVSVESHGQETNESSRAMPSFGDRPHRILGVSIVLAISLQTLCTSAAITHSWRANTPTVIQCYQGEDIALEPTFSSTNLIFTTYWQTNGMDNIWWSTPGTYWSNTNDVGASNYRFFVQAKSQDSTLSYRANGTIRMLPSPGYNPNTLTLPLPLLDFSVLSVTNAPFATFDYVDAAIDIAITNAPGGGGGGVVVESDPIWQAAKSNYATKSAVGGIVTNVIESSTSYMTINDGTLSIYSISNNVSTNMVWSSAEAQDGAPDAAATNALWRAISNVQRDWGSYQASGADNPDADNFVIINKPATMFAAGYEWETLATGSGTIAVLMSEGTVNYACGTNGSFRIGTDSTNYFGYAQSGNVVVGATATSINVTDGIAMIDYDWSNGDHPIVYHSASLLNPSWVEVTDAVWIDVPNDYSRICVDADTQGYFKATTTSEHGASFVSTMPIVASGGYRVGADTMIPTEIITISHNGKQYRVLAEEVD